MGDSGGEHRVFSLNPKGAGTLKLQDVVQEKLLGFMEADYTDRVLAEYIVVLVAHGKTQSQAAGELEAFLGAERSQSFTKWLWDHVSTNLSIYSDASEVVHASGGDEELQQDEVSSDSVASEGPESDDEEQALKSSKGAEYTSVKEDKFRDEVEDHNVPTDNRYDRRTEERGGRARGYEEDSSRHRHGRDTSGRGGRGLEERYPDRHREERRHGSPLGRHDWEERLSHHGRHSKEKLHREQRGRGFQEQDREREEGRGRERERAREKERSRGHDAGLPPPPRGEPSFEERRGDREYAHKGEHRGRSEEAARVAGRGHDEMPGQKRVRSVAQADLDGILCEDAPGMPDEPPPPPRSRPRLAGIPDYARMMGIALKAVAAAADEAAQAANGGTGPPPAGVVLKTAGGNVWDRLGREARKSSGRDQPKAEEAGLQQARGGGQVQGDRGEERAIGADSERGRMNAKLRERLEKAADVTRKVVRSGPAGPSVTVTYQSREQAVRRPSPSERQGEEETWSQPQQARRDSRLQKNGLQERLSLGEERGRRWVEEAAEEDQELEEGGAEEAEMGDAQQEGWQEGDGMEEHEGGALLERQEAAPEEAGLGGDVDAAVAEMKQRMRAVQLEMTKLRAKQREAEQARGPGAPGMPALKPLVKAPTQQELDARTVFASNVHFAASKEALAVHFGQAGSVMDVRILLDPATGRPRGCAYITFDSEEAAEQALSLDNTSILSRQIKVAPKSSAAGILQTLPTFAPLPLPTPAPTRGPRLPLRRGNTKWVRPGAIIAPPAKSPRSPTIPLNLKWRRSTKGEVQPATEVVAPQTAEGAAVGDGLGSVARAARGQALPKPVPTSGGAARGRSFKYQRPAPYPAPAPNVE